MMNNNSEESEMNATSLNLPEHIVQIRFLLEGCFLPVVAVFGLAGQSKYCVSENSNIHKIKSIPSLSSENIIK